MKKRRKSREEACVNPGASQQCHSGDECQQLPLCPIGELGHEEFNPGVAACRRSPQAVQPWAVTSNVTVGWRRKASALPSNDFLGDTLAEGSAASLPTSDHRACSTDAAPTGSANPGLQTKTFKRIRKGFCPPRPLGDCTGLNSANAVTKCIDPTEQQTSCIASSNLPAIQPLHAKPPQPA